MQLIPVIDLLGGQVVHAVGGRRAEYRPVVSTLTNSCELPEVAAALLARTGSPTLYVADLDAIRGTGDNDAALARWLASAPGVTAWLDRGIRTLNDVIAFPNWPGLRPVLGTETLTGPEAARAAATRFGESVLSVDATNGELLGAWAAFGVTHSRAMPEMARVVQDLTRSAWVILLDLARVGVSQGTASLEVIAETRRLLPPTVRLAVGGGVRDAADVGRLADCGVDAALVATALHAGALP